MDNLTHSLVGWAVGQTGLKRKTRKGLAALILGANMPDVDVFFGWVPWAPLATHRGFTHGLVGGVLLMPPILAGLLWLLDRWQVRRGVAFPSGLPMRAGWLLALSYIGTLTHPLLDWQTAYAIQLFSPFDTRWYHTDSLFIIDVWIWLGLAAAIWLSMRREAQEMPGWGKPAIVALTVLVAYVSLNIGLSTQAKQLARERSGGGRVDVIVANPPPGLFWRRDLVWREAGWLWRARYDPFVSPRRLTGLEGHPAGMSALARRLLLTRPELTSFRRWSILPVTVLEQAGCEASIGFNDARFADGLAGERFSIWIELPRGQVPGC